MQPSSVLSGAVACFPCVLTCALSMTSSHAKVGIGKYEGDGKFQKHLHPIFVDAPEGFRFAGKVQPRYHVPMCSPQKQSTFLVFTTGDMASNRKCGVIN